MARGPLSPRRADQARTAVLVVLALCLLLAGCGESVVLSGPPSAPRYEGPLVLDLGALPSRGSTGAAGRVVQCAHPEAIAGWASPSPHDGDVVTSPRTALRRDLAVGTRGAVTGYQEMRREDERVLYVRAVDAVVRQATIVRRGPAVDGRTGWYVESWARCDWAELPPSAAEGIGLQVWSGADGRPVPTTRVSSSAGPEHCDWQDMTFLQIDGGQFEGGRSYVADLQDGLREYASGPFRRDVALPADAEPTGYHRNDDRLWLSADGDRAYVGASGSVDVWPRITEPLGCA